MRKRFQYQIATGRLTLPVAIILSVILWVTTFNDKMEVIPFLTGGVVTYLLIELNTSFALVRNRSSLPSALFAILFSSSLFLHEYGKGECLILLLFMGSLYCLLKGYESKYHSSYIFHTFLWLSLGSIIEPGIILSAPPMLIVMCQLRMLSVKTFFAGIIGLCTPYWLITGYEIYSNNDITVLSFFNDILKWSVDDYKDIPLEQYITTGCLLFLSSASGISSIIISQNDKVRNRTFIWVMNTIGIYETLLMLIRPVMLKSILPIVMTMLAILYGYDMIQRTNKLTYISMIISLVIIVFLTTYNLMCHFSFVIGL